MNTKSFAVLAGATALSLAAAVGTVAMDRTEPALASAGQLLLPGLESSLGDVATITVRKGDFEQIVEQRDGIFVDQISGYPVDQTTIRELVGTMALAQIAEAKTNDPLRHGDLALAPHDAEEGAGTQIVLSADDDTVIADLIVGNRDFTLGGGSGGQYVRRGDEEATWLVSGNMNPPTRRSTWFETRLVEEEAESIVDAKLVTTSGEVFAFERIDDEFALATDLEIGQVPSENQVARIPRVFANFDFDDVRPDSPLRSSGASLSIRTDAGLQVTLVGVVAQDEADDERTWVRINVGGEGEAADALRERVDGFQFALQSSDATVFNFTSEDLIEAPSS